MRSGSGAEEFPLAVVVVAAVGAVDVGGGDDGRMETSRFRKEAGQRSRHRCLRR